MFKCEPCREIYIEYFLLINGPYASNILFKKKFNVLYFQCDVIEL